MRPRPFRIWNVVMLVFVGLGFAPGLLSAAARANEPARERGREPEGEAPADKAPDEEEDPTEAHPARRALEREVPKLRIDAKPLREAIDAIAKACNTTFHIDHSSLEKAGAKLDAVVSVLPAAGQTGESVLKDILTQAAGGGAAEKKAAMDHGAWGGVVVVSTANQITVTRRSMDRALPGASFAGAPLPVVLGFLKDISGQEILVDWTRLKTAGVTREAGVTINVQGMSVGDALPEILNAAGAKQPLAFVHDGGALVITRRDAIAESLKDPKSLAPPEAAPDGGKAGDGL